MKLKILVALLLTLVAVFSACGGENDVSSAADSSEEVEGSSAEESSEEPMEFIPFVVKADEKGDGTVSVTVSVPANVSFGHICLTASENLEYVEDSMKSSIGAVINPAYDKNGVKGQYATFAAIDAYEEGAVVFTADYRIVGESVGAADFTVPTWEHGHNLKLSSDQSAGTITVEYNSAAE